MNYQKSSIFDLAIFNNQPAFSEKLHVNRPNLGNTQEFNSIYSQILKSYWFTNNGPVVRELESKLEKYLGIKHCILAVNGTIALMVLLKALDLKGEIILPSFNFISTAHTLNWLGIKPVFCDISPLTWNIDSKQCEKLISKKTSAIIGTHLWGRSCDVDNLNKITESHGLKLIFDAAHAFGCSHKGILIGSFGDAEVFSFHATKVFHTFEGGAITTNNSDLANQIRTMQNFGFSGYDQVEVAGTNAKMTEICAGMGLVNLNSINKFIMTNKRVYLQYQESLKNIPGVHLLQYNTNELHNYHYVVLKIDEEITLITRDEIMELLHAENILARRYFFPGNHAMEPFNSLYPEISTSLPITNSVSNQVLLLPGGASLIQAQVNSICSILKLIVNNAKLIKTERA